MATPQITPSTPPHDPADEPELRAAATRIAPELALLADDEAVSPNVDIPTAFGTTLAYWPVLSSYIAAVVQLPTINASRTPKLRDYALAMNHWHSVVQIAQAPVPDLSRAVDAGIITRDRMMKDLAALAAHGILDAKAFASIGGTTSYRKVGQDLIDLGTLVHARWINIGSKSLMSLTAADNAIRQGQEILRVMVERDRAPLTVAAASIQRNKAFTLFIRTYDDTRQALLFLRRREGDADSILPTLYPGRSQSKKRGENPSVDAARATANAIAPTTAAPNAFADDAFDP